MAGRSRHYYKNPNGTAKGKGITKPMNKHYHEGRKLGYYGCVGSVVKVGIAVPKGKTVPTILQIVDCPACGDDHPMPIMWRKAKTKEPLPDRPELIRTPEGNRELPARCEVCGAKTPCKQHSGTLVT